VQKNELLVAQAELSAQKFAEGCRVVRTVVIAAFAFWAVSIIVGGLVEIAKAHPDAIGALSRVVEAFKLDKIVWAFGLMITGGAWALERRGRKRAVKQLGEARRKLEAGDAYRSSSRLTRDGSTPAEVRDAGK
jgi:hypothetical protein